MHMQKVGAQADANQRPHDRLYGLDPYAHRSWGPHLSVDRGGAGL